LEGVSVFGQNSVLIACGAVSNKRISILAQYEFQVTELQEDRKELKLKNRSPIFYK
jgi:hypothetical protein